MRQGRKNYAEYEEVVFPVAEVHSGNSKNKHRLIAVSDLEPWMRPVYKYKTLNFVQSVVFDTAFKTAENMLVCAPTGAGKTDVALLAILSTVRKHIMAHDIHSLSTKDFAVDKRNFRIIYVAPMKALAAEITKKFSERLSPLLLRVREWTGDIQLSRKEVEDSTVIVTTPEKYDVITRKPSIFLDLNIALLIIDEVHLLHDDRGAVLEAIIARTLRQVESSQSLIRIVGLSATLPNYGDVAEFLKVNPLKGLFYFGPSFRPVPLQQTFIGVKGNPNSSIVSDRMNNVAYKKAKECLQEDKQAMIFVHSRKQTVSTARRLDEISRDNNESELLGMTLNSALREQMLRDVEKSKNSDLRELAKKGFGIHHAGMLRSDRLLVEKYFALGVIRILVCTATLAWGVNLPAYSVIIKGTLVFDAERGGFKDLSVLDVLQIFGRAGRPQYENSGLGTIITTHDKLAHYISRLTSQLPIESTFGENLLDNLNAEINSTGTVSNIVDAVRWLGYTYFFIRMKKNPTAYGLQFWDPESDPALVQHRKDLCLIAARQLSKRQMIIFNENSGMFHPKDFGRIAAQYYISSESVEIFNQSAHGDCSEADVIQLLACVKEFDSIKLRDSEFPELDRFVQKDICPCELPYGPDHEIGKRALLVQALISRYTFNDFGLVSDMNYIGQNAPRVLKTFFELSLKRGWGSTASKILSVCISIERRMWFFEHPLIQFAIPYQSPGNVSTQAPLLPSYIISKLSELPESCTDLSLLRTYDEREIAALFRNSRISETVLNCIKWLPRVDVGAKVVPVTKNVILVDIEIVRDFVWNVKYHGFAESWWVWIEDEITGEILAKDNFSMTAKEIVSKFSFYVPVGEPVPSQLFFKVASDKWHGAQVFSSVAVGALLYPKAATPHTNLLKLKPFPTAAIKETLIEKYFSRKFSHFNPIQTQVFHTLFHRQNENVLIGAPTGSGKTVCAELAILSALNTYPDLKVVYIAPLKALVKERIYDWGSDMNRILGVNVVELTGETAPDLQSLSKANLIVATPEKFDSITRLWKSKGYIKSISLVVMDEIHLLGGERGPTLEIIVSRMNNISHHSKRKIRLVGLSTALSNAADLASWLDVHPNVGFFNFRHSVRPVPLEIFIDSFSGRHYCPRMASMNKPIFESIMTHSPDQPVLVFVSSRRQTRLTAQDLITHVSNNISDSRRFLRMDIQEIESLCEMQITDANLRLFLPFGIGLHHAGLDEHDRKIVSELFQSQKIQVLITTSTLAWGVNYPAHLVIVKGTEFFDPKSQKYVDYPLTDVLQMIGRAGRPQFDTTAVAHIMVHEQKKSFYKRFLHEPFPVESALFKLENLVNHINAEIVAGTIKTFSAAMEFLTWTYLYRRLKFNPNYYGITPAKDSDVVCQEDINEFLSKLLEKCIKELVDSSCLSVSVKCGDVQFAASKLGFISAMYYLDHRTVRRFREQMSATLSHREILGLLASASEYAEFPVRHNEDLANGQLQAKLRYRSITETDKAPNYLSPHEKTFLLLQSHLARLPHEEFPIFDYVTDMKMVLDQAVRIVHALIDVASELDMVSTMCRCIELMQCIKCACWWDDDPLYSLGIADTVGVTRSLPELLHSTGADPTKILTNIPIVTISRFARTSFSAVIDVHVLVELKGNRKSSRRHAYCPYFGKTQPETLFVIMIDGTSNSVAALKRIRIQKTPDIIQMKFELPKGCDDDYTNLKLILMNDSYVGLDQEYRLE